MANPLDPPWQSYEAAQEAFVAVRRIARLATGAPPVLVGTRFDGKLAADVDIICVAAARDLDDQTVLFLYAAFESALRDHLAAQAKLLAAAAGPHASFGPDLAAWFAELCDDVRMDGVTRLYTPAAGPTLFSFIGNVRKYRHWLAHGSRGTAPPAVSPQMTYARLTQFLQACGLI